MWILPSFFPPKLAPNSKVWRGHLRQGSQDFIDYINGLGNFRGISGLIHPDQAVFHWEFWICQFFWIFPPPSAAQMQCNCFPAIRIRSANQRIENKNKSESWVLFLRVMEKKQHFLLIFSITLKSETLDLWKVNTECNSILLCLFPQPFGEINTKELHKIRYLLLWFHRYSEKRPSTYRFYVSYLN